MTMESLDSASGRAKQPFSAFPVEGGVETVADSGGRVIKRRGASLKTPERRVKELQRLYNTLLNEAKTASMIREMSNILKEIDRQQNSALMRVRSDLMIAELTARLGHCTCGAAKDVPPIKIDR